MPVQYQSFLSIGFKNLLSNPKKSIKIYLGDLLDSFREISKKIPRKKHPDLHLNNIGKSKFFLAV